MQQDKTGEAEVHMEMNDTIIIERGRGTFWVGGQIKGSHEIRPTEWRGEMSGAREYSVRSLTCLLIPAGMPHKGVVSSGTFTYFTIKTPRQPSTASAPQLFDAAAEPSLIRFILEHYGMIGRC
jgi:mannose-6-phosphate isomerase-like protein (cupin superfamily)